MNKQIIKRYNLIMDMRQFMIFDFNNDIDIIYALDYFIKRDSNNLKIYNPSNFNFDLNDLDNLYKNYVTENELKEWVK